MFSDSDHQQIKDHGLTIETVELQLKNFREGFPPAVLSKPSIVNDGILKLDAGEVSKYIDSYDKELDKKDIVKFVPASGAATRMFKNLFAFHSEYDGSEEAYKKMQQDNGKGSAFEFFKKLENFAFYEDLKESFSSTGVALEEAHLKKDYIKILDYFLTDIGLDYGSLPKGLLKFHKYGDVSRTPLEEHIVEGAKYAKGKNDQVNIHFTVSPDHMEKFKEHVAQVKSKYESEFGCTLNITYSIQNPATDTIAADMNNEPFRENDGTLLFRPAGHGALLENLNSINADLVFIKNIDNVVPDSIKDETITYKKVLAGVLVKIQNQVFKHLEDIENGNIDIATTRKFIKENLGYSGKLDTTEEIKEILDRPIRVCGMVQSDGDPGGGPFWVQSANDESISLQIVETAQIDLLKESQKKVFNQATHFNPVDLVCGMKNHKGEKYDLMKYRDMSTGFVTKKSKDGKDLKAQELPGLWNGSMAFWNTIFVEVPLITFNPVKVVNDLLKPEHQTALK